MEALDGVNACTSILFHLRGVKHALGLRRVPKSRVARIALALTGDASSLNRFVSHYLICRLPLVIVICAKYLLLEIGKTSNHELGFITSHEGMRAWGAMLSHLNRWETGT